MISFFVVLLSFCAGVPVWKPGSTGEIDAEEAIWIFPSLDVVSESFLSATDDELLAESFESGAGAACVSDKPAPHNRTDINKDRLMINNFFICGGYGCTRGDVNGREYFILFCALYIFLQVF